MTTAANASNSMPTPRLAVAPAVREASSHPAKPAMAPDRMKVIVTSRSTGMPARKAAIGVAADHGEVAAERRLVAG